MVPRNGHMHCAWISFRTAPMGFAETEVSGDHLGGRGEAVRARR